VPPIPDVFPSVATILHAITAVLAAVGHVFQRVVIVLDDVPDPCEVAGVANVLAAIPDIFPTVEVILPTITDILPGVANIFPQVAGLVIRMGIGRSGCQAEGQSQGKVFGGHGNPLACVMSLASLIRGRGTGSVETF